MKLFLTQNYLGEINTGFILKDLVSYLHDKVKRY